MWYIIIGIVLGLGLSSDKPKEQPLSHWEETQKAKMVEQISVQKHQSKHFILDENRRIIGRK